MSSPAANEGAYSYREQQFRALANGPQMYSSGPGPSSSPDRMPARRGGLNAEPESMTAAGGQQYSYNNHHQLQQQQQQPQYQQRHQPIHHSHSYPQAHQLTHSREGATSAAATAATTTTSSAGRDRNPDRNPDNHLSKHREASLPGNLQSTYSSADDNDSLPPICPPQLQIRFTPHSRQGSVASHSRQGSVTGLQIKTDIPSASASPARPAVNHTHISTPSIPIPGSSSLSTVDSASHSLTPTTDLRKAISAASLNSSLSPSGGLGSPYLSAMVDITPLPSPIMPGELSPVPWKRIRENEQRNRSRERSTTPGATQESGASTPPPRYNLPISPDSPPRKQRGYGSLMTAAIEARAAAAIQENALAHDQNSTHLLQQPHAAHGHARNRSISDFKPEQLQNTRPRNVTINYTAGPPGEVQHQPMHREQYLAAQRGLLNAINPLPPPAHTLPDPTKALPSPPPSNKSVTGSEMDEEDLHTRSRPSSSQHSPLAQLHTEQTQQEADADDANAEYFLVRETNNPSKKRKWRALRPLGQGTFSKVILATSERLPARIPYDDENLDPAKLVAIKIVEHGPAGGADEERIEVSLKREVDILKSIRHPCIVQLKAMEYTDDRALLVLTFCPGGDLFDLASHRRDLLTKDMVQRIFGEVLSAVRWLHEHGVVHRDLKLENVLVHPKADFLASLKSPQTHPHPLTLLTDLGLSRRIPPPPASPLLTTRCGSEDYAAPEILLGQPYDGRSTDAWALGVLLYALMEGRLPFDTPPGKPERSRVSHRVARCDWIWARFGDEYGDWDEDSETGVEWRPARKVVEALLKKVRMGRKSLKDVEGMEWVVGAIRVPGGLRRVDDGEGEV